ncbi:hypothetical protein GCM10011247_21910 [Pseudomonas plecoglossicida]|nr:hypothetical protein GCM10011247_21910 [Pseudomonas plecoglossicida]
MGGGQSGGASAPGAGPGVDLIAGKPTPTDMAQFSNPVLYLWEPACRRLGCAAAPEVMSICRAPIQDARVSLPGSEKKTDPQWNAANDPDLFPPC